jgi:hypothetical protein
MVAALAASEPPAETVGERMVAPALQPHTVEQQTAALPVPNATPAVSAGGPSFSSTGTPSASYGSAGGGAPPPPEASADRPAAASAATAVPAPPHVITPEEDGEYEYGEYYSDEMESPALKQQPGIVAPSAAGKVPPALSPSVATSGGDLLELSPSEYSHSHFSDASPSLPPTAPPSAPGASARSDMDGTGGGGDAGTADVAGTMVALADVSKQLLQSGDEEEAAFCGRLTAEAPSRLAAMEGGCVMVKFNAAKGMFGLRSEASRMVERLVVLSGGSEPSLAELCWGDPKTGKLTTQIRLSDCKGVLYGAASETLASFSHNPHAAWHCFSVEAGNGRTFDFAAGSEAEAHMWYCGLSALIGKEVDYGWLLRKTTELKTMLKTASEGEASRVGSESRPPEAAEHPRGALQ